MTPRPEGLAHDSPIANLPRRFVGSVVVFVLILAIQVVMPTASSAQASAAARPRARIPTAIDPAIAEAKMAVRRNDFKRAVALWNDAASRGNAEAAYRLGVAYRSGLGVAKDVDKAAQWFKLAVERRDPDAYFTLGTFYQNGTSVEQNRDEALRLFTLAARAGNRAAQATLARIKAADSVAYAAADARVVANRSDPREALAQAIRTGDTGSAQEAIARGAPVNGAPGDEKHWRPLVLAISKRNREMVDLLLTHGADPNIRSRAGEPALILAVRSQDRALVRRLLKGRAETDVSAKSGYTPLMEAARLGSRKIVLDLLDARVDPKAVLDDGTSAADVARRFGYGELAREIASKGAPVLNPVDPRKRLEVLKASASDAPGLRTSMPPVVEAARRGDVELLKEMLGRGIDLAVEDSEGGNALTRAAEAGHLEAVSLLVQAGLDPDLPGREDATALMRAVESQSPESEQIVAVLLEAGANPYATDAMSRGLIDYAASGATIRKLELIEKAGGSWSDMASRLALEDAAEAGRLSVTMALVTVVATPDARGHAVCRAVEQGNIDVFDVLTAADSSLDVECGDGRPPLVVAAHAGNQALVVRLLDAGAKIDGKAGGHDTALIAAAGRGHARIVQLLLERGADVNRRGARRMTALMAASLTGSAETAEILLVAGADRAMRSDTKQTALDLAKQSGDADAIGLIETYRSGWQSWFGSSTR